MEITKKNESFSLKEITDQFEMTGTASHDVSGSLNIHFNVNNLEGARIGDCHYNKYSEAGEVNFGVNCTEDKRDELTLYADTVVDSVLAFLKGIE